jgi:Spy/CpxP family protein refolding chaperone
VSKSVKTIREILIAAASLVVLGTAACAVTAKADSNSGFGPGYGMMGGMGYGMGPGMMGGMGYGMGRGMGYGMMGGYGTGSGMMMGGMGYWMLELSKAQRNKMEKIAEATRKANWALMGKMMDDMVKLRDLYAAEKLDAKKIGAVYGKMFDIRRQMIENQIEATNKARDVLTKEQKEELRKRWSGNDGSGTHGARHDGPLDRSTVCGDARRRFWRDVRFGHGFRNLGSVVLGGVDPGGRGVDQVSVF